MLPCHHAAVCRQWPGRCNFTRPAKGFSIPVCDDRAMGNRGKPTISPWSKLESQGTGGQPTAILMPFRKRRRGRIKWARIVTAAAFLAFLTGLPSLFPPPSSFIDGISTHALPVIPSAGVPARAMPKCSGPIRRNCVVDGDTLWVDGEKVRIANINAPEIKGRCANERRMAVEATDLLRQQVTNKSLRILRSGTDKYGRTLATIAADGRDVDDILVAEGLAERWGGTRIRWCMP